VLHWCCADVSRARKATEITCSHNRFGKEGVSSSIVVLRRLGISTGPVLVHWCCADVSRARKATEITYSHNRFGKEGVSSSIVVLRRLGISTGPVFRVGEGSKAVRARARDLNRPYNEYLERVQDRWPEIIPAMVNVRETYSIQRSIRRESTSQARNREIPKDVINGNNRWRAQDSQKS
jgi:hypothetical protein